MTRRHPTDGHVGGIAAGQTHLVRQATAADLPAIIIVHQKAFRNFFLTRLGNEFLRRYYSLVLDYPSGIVLVSERSGTLEGFVCGFVEPPEFYRMMWCNKRTFALPALSAVVRHPSLATSMLHGVQRVQSSLSKGSARACELSSIAVAPEAGGNGLGRALVQAFVEWASSMDAQCVYLTTDADGNEPANALYRQVGFQHTQRFLQRKGRWMNEYVIEGLGAGEIAGCAHE
jgi:ribosomal protein S18 acetylase RimI-like enzyme